MAFKKLAFKAPEHLRVAKKIMGQRFDESIFWEMQHWMDGRGGKNHRKNHGHDIKAEKFVRDKWSNVGVEIFHIHILVDRVQEELPNTVEQRLNQIAAGKAQVPYFTEVENMPHCQHFDPSFAVAADSEAKVLQAIERRCANCGSENNLDFDRLVRGFVCGECLSSRSLEVCCRCRAFFAAQLKKPDPVNEGKFICPVCDQPAFEQ